MSMRVRDYSPQYSSNLSAYGRERSTSRSRFKSRSRSPSPYYSSRRHRERIHKTYAKKDDRDYEDSYGRRGDRDKPCPYDRLSKERDRDRDKERDRDRDRERDRDRGERDRDREIRYWKVQEGGNGGASSNSSRSRWERRSMDLDDATATVRWDRDRDRERDRYERETSIDSDCSSGIGGSSGGLGIGSSGSEIIGFKSQPPNNTIMIRGLAQHITENDIRQDIIQCGLMPKDIRLIRKKDTGASRGFAFVEFTTLVEATRWMEMKQGILMLQDQYRAIMQYSIPKELCPSHDKAPTHKASADWFCIKCGAQNFKRRDNCFKCHASRMESEEGGSGSDEICTYTTKTIMLRNLDALTTEDTIMSMLTAHIPDLVKSISCVTIGRDPLTSTSRGICYLGTESTVDALAVYGALHCMQPPLTIDGKTVILSYCKYNMGDSKHVYAAPAKEDCAVQFGSMANVHSAFGATASVPTAYALQDVQNLAEYAAARYAKSDSEYHVYIDYYRNYFTRQINAGQNITLNQQDHYHNKTDRSKPNQSDATNAAAALAQSAIRQMNATKSYFDNTHMVLPTGTDGKRYPIPEPSSYVSDKTTGYNYDPQTGLYYDPTSQYYWNSVVQKFLYWDQEKLTYVLAPDATSAGATYGTMADATDTGLLDADGHPTYSKKSKSEKQDKAKVAKKIAKDMERWAKTMNQRKEGSVGDVSIAQAPIAGSTVANANVPRTMSLDIGYSTVMDNNKRLPVAHQLHVNGGDMASADDSEDHDDQDHNHRERGDGLVAAYGGESESSSSGGEDGPPSSSESENNRWLDYNRLICTLCKRQLNSAEALTKHVQLSDLHKTNLEKQQRHSSAPSGLSTSGGGSMYPTQQQQQQQTTSASGNIRYRDRARERRLKYGDPDEPTPSRLKEKFLRSRTDDSAGAGPSGSSDSSTQASSVLAPISSENVGNRLLQKMGWSEGQGLGKANQGRTTIIQAEQRASNVGLGNKSIYTGVAGESYKDCVKKMMYARYQELADRE